MSARVCALLLAAMTFGCATPAPAPPLLVGAWHQDRAECGDAAPIAELIFHPGGDFSVTWFPFETYKDYWGTWRFDQTSNVLALHVDGGNYIPPDVSPSAVVQVDEHQLSLGAISLGSPPNHDVARCTAAFRR